MAVGADSSSAGVAAVTTNSGAAWTNKQLPSGTPELDAISCDDATDCVAAGSNELLTTHDGGNDWRTQSPPVAQTTVLGVTCGAVDICLATGMSPNFGQPYAGQVFRSTDNGNSWTSVNLPPGTDGIGDVTCPTTTFCVAVGVQILVSNDGGLTWQLRTVDGGTGALRSVTCSSALHCLAMGANPVGVYDSTAPASAVVSNDGGQTWQQESMPSGTATIDQIACSAPSSCVAGGGRPRGASTAGFAQTGDGGTTWSSGDAPPGVTSVAGISCPAAEDCLIVGHEGEQPVSDVTSDGRNWRSTSVPQS